MQKLLINLTIVLILMLTHSCGIYKYSDAKKNPTNADERIKKNIKEGKGFRLSKLGQNSSNNFQFATSNPMWRATIEKLNFAPFSNVDYAGGIIVTDWINEGESDEQLKITVRFLSNEIRSDAIDVIIHKKICKKINNCKIDKIESNLNSEIRVAILKKAAEFLNEDVAKQSDESDDYKIPGKSF